MSRLVYFISRELGTIAAFVIIFMLVQQDEWTRSLSLLSILVLFLSYSKMYEKKYKVITPSYAFVFIILLVDFTFVPAYCTQEVIDNLNSERSFAFWSNDFYWIYYFVVLIVFFIINYYVRLSPIRVFDNRIKVDLVEKTEYKNTVIGSTIIFILYLLFQSYEMLIVIICGSITYALLTRRYSILYQVVIVVFLNYSIIFSRFKIAAAILSMVFVYILITKKNAKRYSTIKANAMTVVGLLVVGVYGIVSEVVKLNIKYQANYDIVEISHSVDLINFFLESQIYRLFAIWTKLGGYIIQHVQTNGFFYGITYIKPLAELLDFEYVSLPIIGSYYNLGSYAQPGLLAEGYANFGIIGSIINILLVFFMMEYLCLNLFRKHRVSELLLLTLPFGQILLDGGTINSALMMIVLTIIYNFDYINTIFRKNRSSHNRKSHICE